VESRPRGPVTMHKIGLMICSASLQARNAVTILEFVEALGLQRYRCASKLSRVIYSLSLHYSTYAILAGAGLGSVARSFQCDDHFAPRLSLLSIMLVSIVGQTFDPLDQHFRAARC
jgi:hypothetical protein